MKAFRPATATSMLRPAGKCLSAILLFALAQAAGAAERVHLLGFVGQLCAGEPYCFDLDVKPEYAPRVGATIRVRFGGVEQIYDAENFRLTLDQQAIGPGAHLRLLLEPEPARGVHAYRASVIWIGD